MIDLYRAVPPLPPELHLDRVLDASATSRATTLYVASPDGRFLGVIETGRYQESLDGGKLFYNEAKYCQSSVQEGPGKILRWGVPDGTRHELTGDLVHDDVILSSALCAILDDQEWAMTGAPLVVHRTDPLLEMDREGF